MQGMPDPQQFRCSFTLSGCRQCNSRGNPNQFRSHHNGGAKQRHVKSTTELSWVLQTAHPNVQQPKGIKGGRNCKDFCMYEEVTVNLVLVGSGQVNGNSSAKRPPK